MKSASFSRAWIKIVYDEFTFESPKPVVAADLNGGSKMRLVSACVTVAAMSFVTSAATGAEPKAATFEEAMANAQPVADLKDLFGPLFADCKKDDELEARQCASVRDWLVKEHAAQTWVALGDESALSFNPYDPSEKKLEMEISGCIA